MRRLVRRHRRVERLGPHALLPHRLDLVAHQGDQRRDDDTDAVSAQRRDLVADRFAGAGRKQHHRIAALDDVVDHRLLLAAEFGMAEDLVQHIARIVGEGQEQRAVR